VKKATLFLCWLVFASLAQAVSAQDKNLTLLDAYSRLSGHVDKAKAAFRRDNLAKCEREVLFCLGRLPGHHEAHLMMSQILYKRGEFEKTLDHIQAAEAGYLGLAEAVTSVQLRKMKERADRVAGLIDDVKEAEMAEYEAKSRGSCQVSAYSKIVQDAKDELIEEQGWGDMDESDKISQIPALYHYVHGNALFRLDRLPEAEAEYRLAVKTDPRYGEAYNNLINILFSQKRLDEARVFLSQADAHKASIHPGLKKAVLESAGK
jgi:tetratricopeptide (TPR) repeat protein